MPNCPHQITTIIITKYIFTYIQLYYGGNYHFDFKNLQKLDKKDTGATERMLNSLAHHQS